MHLNPSENGIPILGKNLNPVKFPNNPVRIVEPYACVRTLRIKEKESGIALLSLLRTKFPFAEESAWRSIIEKGYITFKGKPCQPEQSFRSGDIVQTYTPLQKEPSVPSAVHIVDETDLYVAVYKPAPMPMHPGGRYFKNTLSHILEEMGYRSLKMAHRLDAVTSGLVLFAKTSAYASVLQQYFLQGKVEKTYHTIVRGVFPASILHINSEIRRKNGFIFECCPISRKEKAAQTTFRGIGASGECSLVECKPLTGRTHQIRLHLKYAGFPIVDDPIYGPSGDDSGNCLQNAAISLQSSGIRIPEQHIDISIPPLSL